MSTAPTDQSNLLWNAPPASRVKPREPEPLWRLTKDGHVMTAGLRYHGEYGVEFQLLRDGDLFLGRRYDLRAFAVAESDALWAQYRSEGWEI
jgi:hypothetical protein